MKASTARSGVMLGLVAIVGVCFWQMADGESRPTVGWGWLQDHAEGFYEIKSLIAIAGVVLLIVHMNNVWKYNMLLGQRFRYLSLFYFATLIATASVTQAQADVVDPITWWNMGAFFGVVLLLVTVLLSMRDSDQGHP